jgi:hypothetical protein
MAIEPLKIPTRTYGEPIPVAPDTNAEVEKINELVAAVNAGLATSNAIVGGDKFVQYLSSGTYGVPAQSLTLDRLDPATILPGVEATVINPHPTPTTQSAPSKSYVATIVPAGTSGAFQVQAYTGATDQVLVAWQEVVSADSFTSLLPAELDAGKEAYAGLALRPLLLKIVGALGTATTITTTTPATTPAATGPTVTGFLPASAAVGASVTITGTGFTKATAVLFNGTPASFQLINATTLVAVVPVDATTGPVAVTNSAGTGTSAANFTVSATAAPTPAGDTVKPDVSFTVPSAGATLPPSTQVLLTAIANDNVAVQGFNFTNGLTGEFIGAGAKNGSTYTFSYTTPAAAGPLSLVGTATDAAGNSQSATVNVTVGSTTTTPTNTAPDISISSPTAGQVLTAGSSLSVVAVATDNVSVASVEFFNAAGVSLGVGAKNGSQYSRSITLPSTAGTYEITAKATDSAGLTSTATVSITVQAVATTPTNQAPSVALSLSTTTTTAGSQVTATALASDSDGQVVNVEFYDGNTLLGSDQASPYAYSWMPAAGTHSITAKVYDNQGATSVSSAVTLTVNSAPVVPGAPLPLVLCIGNSQTYGPNGSGDSLINSAGHEAWPDVMLADLNASSVQYAAQVFGYPGSNSTQILGRVYDTVIPWLNANASKYSSIRVIYQEITNDEYNNRYDADQVAGMYQDFTATLAAIKAISQVTSVSAITGYYQGQTGTANPPIDAVNVKLIENRNTLGLKQVFDMRTVPLIRDFSGDTTSDYLHLNTKGNAIMGHFMANGIRSGAGLYRDPSYVAPVIFNFANASFNTANSGASGDWRQFAAEYTINGNGDATITNASGGQNSWLFQNNVPLVAGKQYRILIDAVFQTGGFEIGTGSGNNGSGAQLNGVATYAVFTANSGSDQFIFKAYAGTTATIHSINIAEYTPPGSRGLLKNSGFADPATQNRDTGWQTYTGVTVNGDNKCIFHKGASDGYQCYLVQNVALDTSKQYRLSLRGTVTSGGFNLQDGKGFVSVGTDLVFTPDSGNFLFYIAAYGGTDAVLTEVLLAPDDASFPA